MKEKKDEEKEEKEGEEQDEEEAASYETKSEMLGLGTWLIDKILTTKA